MKGLPALVKQKDVHTHPKVTGDGQQMPQPVREEGKQVAGKGLWRAEFELNLKRNFDFQKLGREIIQLCSNTLHLVCVLTAYCVQGTVSVPWLTGNGYLRTECAHDE